MGRSRLTFILITQLSFCVFASAVFSAVSPSRFVLGLPLSPPSLLYFIAPNEISLAITQLVLEPLIEMDRFHHKPVARLARQWKLSPDRRSVTFTLDGRARFADGSPVRTTDVLYTWRLIQNPAHKTAFYRSLFSDVTDCSVLSPSVVKFTFRSPHFKNLSRFEEFFVVSEKTFSAKRFNQDFNYAFSGSGPYSVESAGPHSTITLRKNALYWGSVLPSNRDRFHFDEIVFKEFSDDLLHFNAFKKGELDYYYFLNSKRWLHETVEGPFRDGSIRKLKVESSLPFGTQGIAWNLRRPLFQEVEVRRALGHLMNRQAWISKLFFDQYGLAAGPVPLRSPFHSPSNLPLAYDPVQAQKLLKKAGWKKWDNEGVLVRNGKRFEFTLLTGEPAYLPVLTDYQQDLKKVGVKMHIRLADWASSLKLTEDREFDAKTTNVAREIVPSHFSVQWGSTEADTIGSANITGYKNPELDRLAKQLDMTDDPTKRVKLTQQIDALIGRDQPMGFTWEPTFYRIAYWNRFSFSGKGYAPYDTWYTLFHSWKPRHPTPPA